MLIGVWCIFLILILFVWIFYKKNIIKNCSLDVGLIKLFVKKVRVKMIMYFKKYWIIFVNYGILSDKVKMWLFFIFFLMIWGKVRWFKIVFFLKLVLCMEIRFEIL